MTNNIKNVANTAIKPLKATLRILLKIFKWAAIGNLVIVTPAINIFAFAIEIPKFLATENKVNYHWQYQQEIYESMDLLNKAFTKLYGIIFKTLYFPMKTAFRVEQYASQSNILCRWSGILWLFVLVLGYYILFQLIKWAAPKAIYYFYYFKAKFVRFYNRMIKKIVGGAFDAVDNQLK